MLYSCLTYTYSKVHANVYGYTPVPFFEGEIHGIPFVGKSFDEVQYYIELPLWLKIQGPVYKKRLLFSNAVLILTY